MSYNTFMDNKQQEIETYDKNKRGNKTLKNICDDVCQRVGGISEEFRDGFEFIRDYDKTVTIFGSARTPENSKEYEQARILSQRIAKNLGYAVITGGGPGIMEAGNRGAFEENGDSLGLNIKLPFEQVLNDYTTTSKSFHYFFARKMCMTFESQAFVYFPGGFGTLDELFEVLTLMQTEKMVKVPIFLVGKKFWKPLDKFIKKVMLKNKTISPEDLDLYTITDDHDLIIDIIKNTPIRKED